MKSPRSLILLCALLLVVQGNAIAYAQSKDETKKFITEKMRMNYSLSLTSYENSVAFEGDVLIVTQKTIDRKTGVIIRRDTRSVDLKELDPKRVKAQDNPAVQLFNVVCHTTAGKKLITYEFDNQISRKREKEARETIMLIAPDERTARQCLNAMVHLIKLSGGKSELFDD